MNIYSIYNLILPLFRKRRMRRFYATFPEALKTATLLDVGGYPWSWREEPMRSSITVVNMHTPDEARCDDLPHVTFTKGDGCNLSFADKAFDIGYSNSVIEHLGTFENQRRFASEVSRVARGVWVQTPAKAFFIEPHYLAPFVHWLPKSVRRRLIRWFTIWGLVTKPGPQQVDEILAEIRLLTRREMADLFPDCEIVTERFFFWPKAYVAVRRLK